MRLTKKMNSFFLTSLLVLVFVFSNKLQAQSAIRMKDDIGNNINLEEPAGRIISLAPHITENLFAAGAGDLVVGAVSYSDYPQAAMSVPRIGTYNNINIEIIVSSRPDLVIAWKEGNQKNQVEKLINLGIPVYINYPQKLGDIATDIKKFGVLTGRAELAQKKHDEYMGELTRLRQQFSSQRKISVFYQTWHKPLLTVNGQQLIGQVLSLCGGRNVFQELPSLTPQVSIEAVLSENPSVIIASGMNKGRPEWLDDWRKWPELKASQDGHLVYVPPNIIQRSTPRILKGTRLVCEALQEIRNNR